MTITKKVVAIVLAFLMIFSSVSAVAYGWDVTSSDGSTLDITAQIYKNANGEWVEAEKVQVGETVKVRVSVGTDYYSNSSSLLFFYDNNFFEDTYGAALNSLTINPDYTVSGLTGTLSTSASPASLVEDLVNANFISSDFADTHNYLAVSIESAAGTTNFMYDDSTWLFEVELKVLDTASGTGKFFVEDATVQSSTNQEGYISVPKGEAGAYDAWDMWLWDANFTGCSDEVSTESTLTLRANGGEFEDGSDVYTTSGTAGTEITGIPAVSNGTKTLIGWYDSSIENPTRDDCIECPTTYSLDADVDLTAFWVEKVTVTFDYNYDGAAVESEDVTPGYEFDKPENPTREGYTFKGWNTDKNAPTTGTNVLPDVYPETSATYYAIWAKVVKTTFVDTLTNETVAEFTGDAGDPFEGTVTAPTHEGYRTIKNFRPAMPTVYPADDTTYSIIYEPHTYLVNYYVYTNGTSQPATLVAQLSNQYDAVINTAKVNYMYTVPKGYALDGWYTDEACSAAFVEGTTLTQVGGINLYAVLEKESYDAVFYVDDNEYFTLNVKYGAFIDIENAEGYVEPTKVGYTFTGWSPSVGYMNEEGKEFYATWTELPRTEEFYVDGELYQIFDTAYGETFDVPADPYKEGYTFQGWDADAAATTPDTLPATMPENNTVYYAVFTANEYTATFDANTGVFADGATTSKQVAFDADILVDGITEPTKTGYTFLGWSLDSAATTGIKTGSIGKMDDVNGKTIYAVWSANAQQYTVNHYYMDVHGQYSVAPEAKSFGANTGDKVTPELVNKDGFTYDAAMSDKEGIVPETGTLTLNVYYTRNQYDLTFAHGYETDEADVVVEDVYYEADITALVPSYTRTGYTQNGWDETPSTMPIGDKTFTAQWKVNQYTVTYMVDGKQYGEVETYNYGDDIKIRDNAAKTGYTFSGWTPATLPATMPDNNITVTGTFAINSYKINYMVDWADGNGFVAYDEADEFVYDTATSAKEAPVKTGYSFSGWMTTEACDTAYVFANMPAKNVTVYGKFTVNPYTINYEVDWLDGNGYVAYKGATVNYGENVSIEAAPVKTGYTFTGWTWTKAADNAAESAPSTMPAYNLKATGTFTANPYTVTFDANAGVYAEGATTTKEVAFDSAITSDGITEPTREGYTFKGWAKTADALAAEDLGIMDDVNGKTVYAVWEIETYTVTWIIEGTSSTTTETYGKPLNPPVIPDKTGYESKGWTPSVPDAMPDASDEALSFIAVYEAQKYAVTFDANTGAWADGTTKDVESVFDKAIQLPADPEKTGYTFIGWSTDKNSETGSRDLGTLTTITPPTYYAIWTADEGGYIVNVYTMDTTGAYQLTTTTPGNGVSDQVIDVTEQANAGLATEGFYLDSQSKLTGTIPSDGTKLELSIYYGRNTHTLTFDANTGYFNGDVDATAPIVNTVYYGAAITAPEVAKTGYSNTWAPALDATMPDADTAYTAIWTANEYTVTFDANGGTGTSSKKVAYDADITVDDIAAPSRTGYTFAGWALDKTAESGIKTGSVGKMDVANDTDKVVYATWTINAYTVTFVIPGKDVAYHTTTAAYGSEVTYPEVPGEADLPAGKSFNAWSPAAITSMPAEDVTVTAVLDDIVYNVNLWVVNDAGETVKSETLTGILNEKITIPAVSSVIRKGYTATGWYTANDIVVPEGEYTVQGNTDLYMHYTANGVEVTFYMDKEMTNSIGTATATYEQALQLTVNEPSKTGYKFAGWYMDGVGEIAFDENGNGPVVTTTAPISVYALWTANEYTVTYVNGTETTEEKVAYDSDIVAPAEPTKTGYTFAGWATDSTATSGSKEAVLGKMDDVNGKTFYATWTPISVDVIFNAHGGKWSDGATTKTEGFAYDSEIKAPAELPVKEGHTLLGWSTDPFATEKEDLGSVDFTAAKTFYAVWTIDSYTASFDANGGTWEDGTTVKTDSYVFGDTVLKYNDVHGVVPVRTGYTFKGWAETADAEAALGVLGKMPASDKTFYAVWDANSYTVTWVVDGKATDVPYDFGAAIVAPENPVKEGHRFVKWTPAVPATMPAENITIVALFETNVYDVIYVVDGKEVSRLSNEFGATISTNISNVYTAPAGYVLSGWYSDAGYTTEFADGTTVPAEAITLYAFTTAISYTVTFDANNGVFADDTDTYTELVEYLGEITAPADPTREGYTFTGWSPAVGAVLDTPDDRTYTATWTALTYDITYYDGEEVHQIYEDVEYGTELFVPADPYRDGVTFVGWTQVKGGTEAENLTGATMPNKDVVYYAIFTTDVHTITYVIDGATSETKDYPFGAAVTVPAPEKVGYTFSGWTWTYVDGEGATQTTTEPATMPAYDLTATGTFTKNTYTVTYMVDYTDGNGYVQYGEVDSYLFEAAVDAVREDISKTGYTFSGWTWEKAEDSSAITAPSLMPAYDIIVRGTLTVNTYDISYKVDYADGQGFVDYGTADSYAYGADVTVKDAPVQDGYVFSGWTFTNAVTGEEIDAPTTMPAYDVNVTGSFSRSSFTITYMVDYADGAGFVQYGDVETKNYGDTLTAPTQPTKPGYAFSGWYTEETLTNAFEFTTMGDSDITLYAKFSITNNAVNFVAPVRITATENYGKLDYVNATTVKSTSADYGTVVSTIAPESAPVLEYYVFKGWSTTPDGEVIDLAATTVPEGGATYYAVYERVAVLLIPNEAKDSTAVIDRADGGDGSGIGTFAPAKFNDQSEWYVYGLQTNMTKRRFSNYLAVQGDGKMEIEQTDYGYGTGTVITVIDNVTGEVVEQFHVVIFGDINGDSFADSADKDLCDAEASTLTSWSKGRRTKVFYKVKAADINSSTGESDGSIDSADTSVIDGASSFVLVIDQVTGGWKAN